MTGFSLFFTPKTGISGIFFHKFRKTYKKPAIQHGNCRLISCFSGFSVVGSDRKHQLKDGIVAAFVVY
ncbi:MAG: hypothetical protein J5941_01870, partial [Solobacterium sp.]|nr:hypothetical protein [Solobacterium sp.]